MSLRSIVENGFAMAEYMVVLFFVALAIFGSMTFQVELDFTHTS